MFEWAEQDGVRVSPSYYVVEAAHLSLSFIFSMIVKMSNVSHISSCP